ncbi:MAG: hypothetical protein HDKAJFGB_00884 [Anaerolineae bacterium]|nr:hypothetical protein [Anaerolineae bacterium]
MKDVMILDPRGTWSIQIKSKRKRLRVDCKAHASNAVAAYVVDADNFRAFSDGEAFFAVLGHGRRIQHDYAVELDKEEVVYFVVRNDNAFDVGLWVSVE